jgi:hypothetical protein
MALNQFIANSPSIGGLLLSVNRSDVHALIGM